MHSRAASVVIIFIALSACGRGTEASALAASFASAADDYTLTWIAPAEYEDGSPLWNLAGFRIYRNGEMILDVDEPSRGWAKVDGKSGDIVWITAYDALGTESRPSDIAALP